MYFGVWDNWNDHLSLVDFTYYNSYQAILRMTPYEALYGWRCRTLVCWEEVGDRKLMWLELVHITLEKVRIINDRIKATQDRHKSYTGIKKRPLEFNVGDKVFLKVASWKNMLRFGMKGKLTPRYNIHFEIEKRIRPIAYKLVLSPYLAKIHDVFTHISLLWKTKID